MAAADSLEYIDRLAAEGLLHTAQAERIWALESGRLLPVRRELQGLLYLGVLFMLYGVGAVVARYARDLGHLAILSALTAAVAGCAVYVARNAPPFSRGVVPSPTFAFDYVLQAGGLLLGTEFAYLETNFHLLGDLWTWYLLAASATLLAAAYRFDNRLTLGLALATLATWAGVRWGWWPGGQPEHAMAYGALVLLLGAVFERRNLKPHFSPVFAFFGFHGLCMAILARMGAGTVGTCVTWAPALTAVAGGCCWLGVSRRWFQFVAYGALYLYAGFVVLIGQGGNAVRLPEELIQLLMGAGAAIMAYALYRLRRTLQ